MTDLYTTNTSLPGRTAHRFATYPGNAQDVVGQVVGPNTLGERMTAVTAVYDPDVDRTRVGFDFTRQEDIQAFRQRALASIPEAGTGAAFFKPRGR